jgi:tRNA 2-thiouridine synthesizing protein A
MIEGQLMKENIHPNYRIDITKDVCPMTFVKTKLQLEKMIAGETLLVRLSEGEALENVPRSVKDQGDKVISVEEDTELQGIHLILIQKDNS